MKTFNEVVETAKPLTLVAIIVVFAMSILLKYNTTVHNYVDNLMHPIAKEDQNVLNNYIKGYDTANNEMTTNQQAQQVAGELFSFANAQYFTNLVNEYSLSGTCVDEVKEEVGNTMEPLSKEEVKEDSLALLNICDYNNGLPDESTFDVDAAKWKEYVERTGDIKPFEYFTFKEPKVKSKYDMTKVMHQLDLLKKNHIGQVGMLTFLMLKKGMSKEEATNAYDLYNAGGVKEEIFTEANDKERGLGMKEAVKFCQQEEADGNDFEFCMGKMGFE